MAEENLTAWIAVGMGLLLSWMCFMDTDVNPKEVSSEQIRDFIKLQTTLFSEHMSRYLEFVRILMLLSGAIIPILLFLPQGSASLSLLIRFAAVGYLFSLICGIYCMMRLIQDPLREQLLINGRWER